MKISFTKYEGTGNDFIMIDGRQFLKQQISTQQIQSICHRRFGIGADGLICIYPHPSLAFEMNYFNADGSRSFCGNGARCALDFAHQLNFFKDEAQFMAIDGIHIGRKVGDLWELEMLDVTTYKKDGEAFLFNTGSPHFIHFTHDLSQENIEEYGKSIRYSPAYSTEGINVNLVQSVAQNKLKIQTYERGVEAETYSCGTGATAVALAYGIINQLKDISVEIQVKGGLLKVKAHQQNEKFNQIVLIGPATSVFVGTIKL